MANALQVVDPDLFVFLHREIQPNLEGNLLYASMEWAKRFDRRCSKSTLDRWLRNPLRMRHEDAERLAAVLNLTEKWERARREPDRVQPLLGPFDYHAVRFGHLTEVDLETARKRGMADQDIAAQLSGIDGELFQHLLLEDEDPEAPWLGAVSDWADLIVAHPETWRAWVTPSNEVIAYWVFVNPRPEVFAKACIGEYPEKDITLASVRGLWDGPVHMVGPGLYVKAGVEKSVRQLLAGRLFMSFAYNLRRLARAGVQFAEICTPIASNEGRALIEKHGFQQMPRDIILKYAANMNWRVINTEMGPIPSIYYKRVDSELRRLMGLSI